MRRGKRGFRTDAFGGSVARSFEAYGKASWRDMADFERARIKMVENQLRANKVTDERLIEAMRALPRERFVPASRRSVAYADEDLSIGEGRWLMEPMLFARLAQLAGERDALKSQLSEAEQRLVGEKERADEGWRQAQAHEEARAEAEERAKAVGCIGSCHVNLFARTCTTPLIAGLAFRNSSCCDRVRSYCPPRPIINHRRTYLWARSLMLRPSMSSARPQVRQKADPICDHPTPH